MPEDVNQQLVSLFQSVAAPGYKIDFSKMLIKISRILELFHFDLQWQGAGNHIFSRTNMRRKVEVRAYDPEFEMFEEQGVSYDDSENEAAPVPGEDTYFIDDLDSTHVRLGDRPARRQQINEGLDESRFPVRNLVGNTRGAMNMLSSIISTPLAAASYLGIITGLNQASSEDTPYPANTNSGAITTSAP